MPNRASSPFPYATPMVRLNLVTQQGLQGKMDNCAKEPYIPLDRKTFMLSWVWNTCRSNPLDYSVSPWSKRTPNILENLLKGTMMKLRLPQTVNLPIRTNVIFAPFIRRSGRRPCSSNLRCMNFKSNLCKLRPTTVVKLRRAPTSIPKNALIAFEHVLPFIQNGLNNRGIRDTAAQKRSARTRDTKPCALETVDSLCTCRACRQAKCKYCGRGQSYSRTTDCPANDVRMSKGLNWNFVWSPPQRRFPS